MPSYLPAYLTRLRASTPRVERVGIALYQPEGRGLVLPSPLSPERELGGEGENEGREDTDPLLPALDAALTVLPRAPCGACPRHAGLCRVLEEGAGKDGRALCGFGLELGVAGCSTWGWNTARRDADAAEADAEAGAERQEAWRAELHACNLDELREEREQGSGMGGG
ncbi:hypothetical protein B0H14DRAFT_3454199 [Mycena olivaceomarginata]|nr:hypothetical protein B0H14DRAFT_3454199 [Mycena olivaceomarginata]